MFHAIVWVQPTKRPEGRTSTDYESVNKCTEGVCKIYEEHLKQPLYHILYQSADTQTYQPYNKDWIKEIYLLLCRQAQQSGK
ncbi:hypothetical protein FD755_015183 [Muntiacus reevesi]|uniref:Enhancer of rudimentary homolog n=1 Tax=Muntiacus reevesi TaxID=9886 RepID=A0A5N3XJS1_MUNRE|nr:hypothetical protein FD755_015183 [Muntiacus reevesi]